MWSRLPASRRRHVAFSHIDLQVTPLERRDLLSANVFKTITIDGDMSDWANVPAYFDAQGNTHDTDHVDPNDTPNPVNHPDVDLLEYKVAYDAENIYFYFRSKGEIGRTQVSTGPGVAAGRYYAITTIDVDQNNVTGYELSEGGYYPTSNGYDVNAEVEYYNGEFNTAHYLNHGATNQAELNQAFLEQSSGLWSAGNDGPYPAGFMTVKPGIYDTYTQWVYHDDDTLTFVRDKGPIVNGIASQFISPDGHSMEVKFPYKGFLKDVNGNSIVGIGSTLDISFSLEASSELSPDHQWASNTAAPVVGFHLNLPSKDSVAVYRDGKFYIDQNNNSAWNGGNGGTNDIQFNFGTAGDKPIAGDWNGDGFEDVGIFRNGYWYLDTNGNHKWDGPSGGDAIYNFGIASDTPVVGDWNHDGFDDIGVYRDGQWYLDRNGNHKWDRMTGGDALFTFGTTGAKPIVGDWNGDGTDNVGYVSNANFYLDLNGNRTWNGTAGDQVTKFGNPDDIPVIGDWNNDNISDIGVFRKGQYLLDRNGNRKWDGNTANADLAFQFGSANDVPVGGRWTMPRVLSTSISNTSAALNSTSPATTSSLDAVPESGGSNSASNSTPLASSLSPSKKSHRGSSAESAGTTDSSPDNPVQSHRRHKSSGAELPTSLVDETFASPLLSSSL